MITTIMLILVAIITTNDDTDNKDLNLMCTPEDPTSGLASRQPSAGTIR